MNNKRNIHLTRPEALNRDQAFYISYSVPERLKPAYTQSLSYKIHTQRTLAAQAYINARDNN